MIIAQKVYFSRRNGDLYMKISTKGRYALRLMVDLAANDNGEYISLKVISKRQDISNKYLEQIITILSKAGYVKSVRGSNGGYKLAKSPKDYTVGMIIRLTEGSLAPVACLDGEENDCVRNESCVTLSVWKKLYKAINDVVDNITLEDLVTEQKMLNGESYEI